MPATTETIEFVTQEYRQESHTASGVGAAHPNAREHVVDTMLDSASDAASLAGILGPLLGDIVDYWRVSIPDGAHQYSLGQWVSVTRTDGAARDGIILDVRDEVSSRGAQAVITIGVSV